MKLLTPTEVRETIATISASEDIAHHCDNMKGEFEPEDVQAFFETMYIGCFRTGELCGSKYPSDKNKNTGHTLKAYTETYTPDDSNQDEIDTLTQRLYIQNIRSGKKELPNLEDVLSIKEPVLVLEVQVEKRKDLFVRHTAIPLRPELEPLAKRVLEYFEKHQDTGQPVFPINRMQALRLAHKIFDGSNYKIRPYRRDLLDINKQRVLKENGKHERITITPNLKPFGDHAVRHSGIEEKKKIGIRGPRLVAFVGWSPKGEEVLEEVYDTNDTFAACRLYLPFLITKRL